MFPLENVGIDISEGCLFLSIFIHFSAECRGKDVASKFKIETFWHQMLKYWTF